MIFIEDIKLEPIITTTIDSFGNSRKIPGRQIDPPAKVTLDMSYKEYKKLVDNYEKRIEKKLGNTIDNVGIEDLIPVMISNLLDKTSRLDIDCITLIEQLSYIVKHQDENKRHELRLLFEKLLFDII